MEEQKESLHLEEEFPSPNYEEWVQIVQESLKGKPFEKAMFTKTPENILLKPIYRKEDTVKYFQEISQEKSFPFFRGDIQDQEYIWDWKISQEIDTPFPKEINEILLKELNLGLDEINLSFSLNAQKGDYTKDNIYEAVFTSLKDMETAFQDIDLTAVSLRIDNGISGLLFFPLLKLYLNKKNIDSKKISGTSAYNPLLLLAETGMEDRHKEKQWAIYYSYIQWMKSHFPMIKTIAISSRPYHEGGCDCCSELAYSFSQLIEICSFLMEKGLTIQELSQLIFFEFHTDSNLFMEAAKLRAARILFANIMDELGADISNIKIDIYSRGSRRNKTVYDPYANMLRSATETFSAVLGGANRIHTCHFNEAFQISTPFSRRIARNQQLILKEESRFHFIADPGAGSWYIESLTKEIADRAWEILGNLLDNGIYQNIINGSIHDTISKQCQDELEKIRFRKKILVGINQFANPEEILPQQPDSIPEAIRKRNEYISGEIKDDSKLEYNGNMDELFDSVMNLWENQTSILSIANLLRFDDLEKKTTEIKKIRYASEFEFLREQTDKYKKDTGKTLKILLLNMGPISQHKARADFSVSFFQAAGFQVINPLGINTLEEALTQLKNSETQSACFCSTDETYPEIIETILPGIQKENPHLPVLLAGYPKEYITVFQEKGIHDFIHLRANALEVLTGLLKKIGVIS